MHQKPLVNFLKSIMRLKNFTKSLKFDWKELIDKDILESVLQDDDENKDFQNTVKPNISNDFKGVLAFESKLNYKNRLARDYRIWANSTPELSRKYGKKSKYDLDSQTNGEPNNSYLVHTRQERWNSIEYILSVNTAKWSTLYRIFL